ncbi:MAG TPA: TolC family protein [Flavipsychrobacter sp.]
MRQLLLTIILLWPCGVNSMPQDSLLQLSKDELVSIVRKYHPVVKQADLSVDRSAAAVTAARGGFDPKLGAELDRKTLDREFYYSYFHPNISIPTWYGLELKAGAEEIVGDRVSVERTLGTTSYAGIRWSVTQGLLFDERRAMLRQAQTLLRLSEAERQQQVNTILYEALSAYWLWVKQYNYYTIYTNAVDLNRQRLMMVKAEFEQGSRPGIDTIEALTQLQVYQLMQNEALMEFRNAGYALSNYLWLEDNQPAMLGNNIVPDTTDISLYTEMEELPPLEEVVVQALNNHPKLRMADFKIDYYDIERRLKAQYLAPKLDINANLLNKGYQLPAELTVPFMENNYKLGVDFSMPLLFRKARGEYKQARIKQQEAGIERDYVALQVENKIKSYYNEVLTLKKQIELYENANENYSRLLAGELSRYRIGESNLFLVNSRENKLLEARRKLFELKTQWHKSYAGMLWAAGIM